jgi:hypothetical protein
MNSNDITSAGELGESTYVPEQLTGTGFSRPLESFAFLAAVFLCSMNYFRTDYIYFTAADLFFLICFSFAVVNAHIEIDFLGRLSTAVWCFGLALLLLGLTASSVASAAPDRGVIVVLQYFYAYFLVLLVLAGRSYEELVAAAKIYILSIVTICIHGIYLINVVGERNTVFVSGNGRFGGLMERENECAAVIALTVSILFLLVSLGKISRPVAFVAFSILAYGLLLTGSNTGLLGFGIVIAIYLLFNLTWKRAALAVLFCLSVPLIAETQVRDYLPVVFQQRVLGAVETGDITQAGTLSYRVELIQEAAGKLSSTLLLGFGADQYRVSNDIGQPVHNIYLLLWTEGGLIAALGFVIMCLSVIGPALSVARVEGGLRYTICIFATLAAFLAMANAMPHMYGRFWPVPLLIPAVLAHAFVRRSRET